MIVEYNNPLESLDDLELLLIRHNAHINNISSLHGFFSAIACSPSAMMPSDVHKIIWGGNDPIWNNMSEAMLFSDTSMSFMLNTSYKLENDDEYYTPLISKNKNLKSEPVLDNWIIGFVEGVSIALQSWKTLLSDKKNKELLLPIIRLYNKIYPEVEWLLDKEDKKKQEEQKSTAETIHLIEKNVPLIYKFFTPNRQSMVGMTDTKVIITSPIDPSSPCICGSDKKYSECCNISITQH